MKMPAPLRKYWYLAVGIPIAVAVYYWYTRIRVTGVVDASGAEGIQIGKKTWVLK